MHQSNRLNMRALTSLALPFLAALVAGCAAPESGPSQQDPAATESAAPAEALRPSATSGVDIAADTVAVDAWELAGYAKDRKLSLEDARQRLGWQALAPRFSERVGADLGERFGGLWIDVDDGSRIKVGVAGKGGADAARVVQLAGEAGGLKEGYDVVTTRHTMKALQSANAWLTSEIARVDAGADVTLVAGLRVDLNAVSLEAPTEGVLSAAQRDLITTAEARLGDMLIVGSYAGRPKTRSCTYPFCDAPLRGGVRILNDFNGCTGAFIARSKVNSVLYQMTAGHCAPDHFDDWNTEDTSGFDRVVGPVWHWEWNSTVGDMAILLISDPTFWNPQPWVNVTASADTTANQSYTITADDESVLGMRICTTGAFLGHSDCGNVTELDVTASEDGVIVNHLGRGSFCGVGGDSGSPMYASHTAFGLQVGGASECDSFYQGVRAAEVALNVNVLHAP